MAPPVETAPGAAAPGGGRPILPPYPTVLVGLGVVGLALLAGTAMQEGAQAGLRALLISTGVLTAGLGLASGLRVWAGRGGLPAIGLWALAAACCAMGQAAMPAPWGSLALPLSVMAVVAAFGAVLTALPPRWRMALLSLAIVGHFVAVAAAVVVVPPTEGGPSWTAQQVWTRWARPHLLFTNLNNGYHFYAPDPGPSPLLWFRVEFADGTSRWLRMPDHEACGTHIERRRWGALASAVGQTVPTTPDVMASVIDRRRTAAEDAPGRPGIPFGAGEEWRQYREPTLQAKMLLASYARHVARTAPHPLDAAGVAVKGVKVYRVEYNSPSVLRFRDGEEPLDPAQYQAYFQGEFDAKGQLTPQSLRQTYDARGLLVNREQGGLLYWLIPIVRVGEDGTPVTAEQAAGKKSRIINYVRIHAGDPGEESVP